MSDLQEKAMKMALGRLESHEYWMDEEAIQALRQALAQPEQEPAGQLQEDSYGRGQVLWFNKPPNETMLYTEPPKREWVGLTDGEITKIGNLDWDSAYVGIWFDFAKAIEAKLKEKNT